VGAVSFPAFNPSRTEAYSTARRLPENLPCPTYPQPADLSPSVKVNNLPEYLKVLQKAEQKM